MIVGGVSFVVLWIVWSGFNSNNIPIGLYVRTWQSLTAAAQDKSTNSRGHGGAQDHGNHDVRLRLNPVVVAAAHFVVPLLLLVVAGDAMPLLMMLHYSTGNC